MTSSRKRMLMCIVLGAMLSFACCVVAGCKYSSYTTRLVYDQAAERTDETAVLPVNSMTAEKTTPDLPQLDVSYNATTQRSEEQVVPVAGEAGSSEPVARVRYNPEATDGSLLAPRLSEQREQLADASAGEVDETDSTAGGTTSDEGSSKEGDGSSVPGNGDEGTQGGGHRSSSEVKVYEDYGAFPEIPEDVEHVAAVGACATTVTVIGGKGALLAGEAAYLGSNNVQKVLGSKLKKAQVLWDERGKLISVKKLVALDIQLVFVDEGSTYLTAKQERKLLKAGIIVYVLPDMSSVRDITSAVSIVGDIFAAGGDKAAAKRADALVSYYEKTVKELKKLNGGEVAGGYDYERSKNVESTVPDVYALFISDWDETAVYRDANGYVASDQGVGIAQLGSAWSPLSYLLSLGGVVDNAAKARYGYLDGYQAFVWQFNQNKVGANYRNWVTFDATRQNYNIVSTDGFTETLLWSATGQCGLGSEGFPRVLVRSQRMRQLMLADAARDNGLYHPYPQVSSGSSVNVSVIGFYANGVLCDACIGTSGDAFESELNHEGELDFYEVVVNPEGLFCSWVDGSIESILEAEWVYGLYYEAPYDIEERVKDFYQRFYGYELSDAELSAILEGPKE